MRLIDGFDVFRAAFIFFLEFRIFDHYHGQKCGAKERLCSSVAIKLILMRGFGISPLFSMLPLSALLFWPHVVGETELGTVVEASERSKEVLEFLLKYEQQKVGSAQVILVFCFYVTDSNIHEADTACAETI